MGFAWLVRCSHRENSLTRLFLEPEHLKPYSLAQVAQGIWFLIGESSPGEPSHALIEPGAALADRIAGIQGMAKFFRNFVASAACGPADTESDPFHIACYMWWDMLPFRPFRGEPLEGEPELHSTCLKVMTEMLDLPSELCQLSALHGLNHWHEHYAEQVEGIIDTFLGRTGNVTPCIREYAAKARAGLCQ